jgi:hypothetical protein
MSTTLANHYPNLNKGLKHFVSLKNGMNKSEISKAEKLLDKYVQYTQTIGDGGGQAITAYWIGGSQKLFRSIQQIEEWIFERERR